MENVNFKDVSLEADYILHAGRKGMKWYQNIFTKDKASSSSSRSSRSSNSSEGSSPNSYRKKYSKKVKNINDQELSNMVKRLQLEKKYSVLLKDRKKNKSIVNKIVNTFNSGSATVSGINKSLNSLTSTYNDFNRNHSKSKKVNKIVDDGIPFEQAEIVYEP